MIPSNVNPLNVTYDVIYCVLLYFESCDFSSAIASLNSMWHAAFKTVLPQHAALVGKAIGHAYRIDSIELFQYILLNTAKMPLRAIREQQLRPEQRHSLVIKACRKNATRICAWLLHEYRDYIDLKRLLASDVMQNLESRDMLRCVVSAVAQSQGQVEGLLISAVKLDDCKTFQELTGMLPGVISDDIVRKLVSRVCRSHASNDMHALVQATFERAPLQNHQHVYMQYLLTNEWLVDLQTVVLRLYRSLNAAAAAAYLRVAFDLLNSIILAGKYGLAAQIIEQSRILDSVQFINDLFRTLCDVGAPAMEIVRSMSKYRPKAFMHLIEYTVYKNRFDFLGQIMGEQLVLDATTQAQLRENMLFWTANAVQCKHEQAALQLLQYLDPIKTSSKLFRVFIRGTEEVPEMPIFTIAAQRGLLEVVRTLAGKLVAIGVDLDTLTDNVFGYTPLQWAEREGHHSVRSYLLGVVTGAADN